VNRRDPDISKQLASLEQGAERFTAGERQQLEDAIAAAFQAVGDRKEAARLWARLAQQRPHDLNVCLHLFELALDTGDEPGMIRQQEAMKRLEGEQGVLWRFAKACRLISKAQHGDQLEEARELLAYVASKRPRWARVAARLGQAEEIAGNSPEALK